MTEMQDIRIYQPETFLGQLQHIIVITIGPSEELDLEKPETIILAAIIVVMQRNFLTATSTITHKKDSWRWWMPSVFNVVLEE